MAYVVSRPHNVFISRSAFSVTSIVAVVTALIGLIAMEAVQAQPVPLPIDFAPGLNRWKSGPSSMSTSPLETRIGIGTATPQATLHINSQNDAALGVSNSGGLMIGRTSSDHLNLVLDGNEIMARRGTASGSLFLNNDGGSVHIHHGKSASSRVSIEDDGRVRIGSLNTQHMQAKLAVDGTIVAKEIIVKLTGFPDYVFADNYRLTPLGEIEAFVTQYRHLPYLPSAKQIEREGAELGEINMRLVRTIEELTLHAIAQQKELDLQRYTLNRLVKRFETILPAMQAASPDLNH